MRETIVIDSVFYVIGNCLNRNVHRVLKKCRDSMWLHVEMLRNIVV